MSLPVRSVVCIALAVSFAAGAADALAEETEPVPGAEPAPIVVGRWNATVEHPQGAFPSWFELEAQADGLGGRFVGRVGSVRPIASVRFDGEQLRFTLPPQYEKQADDLLFIGRLEGEDLIEGETFTEESYNVRFVARRALALEATAAPRWGEPVTLIGEDLSGWRLRDSDGPNGWSLAQGVLSNEPPSVDLITHESFRDFTLSGEFLMPPGSNSGIYLRGRYEMQIQDDHGKPPDERRCGGIYGFVAPSRMACRPAGEWNSVEITLLGRTVTVVLNGETVIEAAEIPGITGGALDSAEAEAGPLMLQGDHRAVKYRKLVLRPARAEQP